MTATEMIPAVGHSALIAWHGITMAVMIHDVKHVYGKTRLHVSPIAGEGKIWIDLDRVYSTSKQPVKVTVTTTPQVEPWWKEAR